MSEIKDIQITCEDQFELTGTLFTPTTVKGAIMIAPATGIRRGFYRAFASYLAENGYGVITFDNRGIGDSGSQKLNQVNASLPNWGKLDMTAVLETLKNQFPETKYHLVGHSAGGQLVGLMNNALSLSSMFNFACSSGCLGNMTYPFKLAASFFLNVYIPLSNFLFGRTNSQWVGMGEPLPKQVAQEWSRWCNGSGYVQTDLGTRITVHLYDDLSMPTRWVHATDDGIANLKNVKDMIRVFPNITSEIITLNPADHGHTEIGHMKFFSSRKKDLWRYALEWLDSQ